VDEPVPLQQAATRFGIKVTRLRRAAWDGRLQARLVGNQWLVPPSEVERFLRDGGRHRVDLAYDAPDRGAATPRIIAIAIPKGGTGKTTTALHLGAALAERGKRVLLVDFDPQGTLTQALGFRPEDLEHTIYTAIRYFLTRYEPQLELTIKKTAVGADLVPTSARLNLANDELSIAIQREFVLQKLLAPLTPRYDYILIDTLPYLGVLVINALVAAHDVLVPVQPEYLATESLSLILDQVQLMRRTGLNPDLSFAGILLTMVDSRTAITREALDNARKVFGSRVPVFNTMIAGSAPYPLSLAKHGHMPQYERGSEIARAYRAVAEELLSVRHSP
jgi:chromosome partitioning protein